MRCYENWVWQKPCKKDELGAKVVERELELAENGWDITNEIRASLWSPWEAIASIFHSSSNLLESWF